MITAYQSPPEIENFGYFYILTKCDLATIGCNSRIDWEFVVTGVQVYMLVWKYPCLFSLPFLEVAFCEQGPAACVVVANCCLSWGVVPLHWTLCINIDTFKKNQKFAATYVHLPVSGSVFFAAGLVWALHNEPASSSSLWFRDFSDQKRKCGKTKF